MSSSETYEALLVEISALQREALIERLARFSGNMRLDFSADYLARCNTEQLRHLLLAALWRCEMKGQVG